MTRNALWAIVGALATAATTLAQIGPTTAPTTKPTTAPAPVVALVNGPLGRITPASGPVAVPFTLSNTNHLVVRLKINGHGPYNFVMDTGAPTLLVDEKVAQEIGLKPTERRTPRGASSRASTRATTRAASRATTRASVRRTATTGPAAASRPTPLPQGWATIDRLDIEGGLSVEKVPCLVLTPYQITGMNAIGAAGMDLHGLMGYSVLARFKLDVDLTKHQMLWTPQPADFVPPPLSSRGGEGDGNSDEDRREARLESVGGLLRVLGPLVKSSMPPPPEPRGWIGVELTEKPWPAVNGVPTGTSVYIAKVYPNSPAERAGIKSDIPLWSVDGHEVHTTAEVEGLARHMLPGQRVVFNVGPAKTTIETKSTVEGNTRTTVMTSITITQDRTITCGEGL